MDLVIYLNKTKYTLLTGKTIINNVEIDMLNIKLADLSVGMTFQTNEGGSVTVINIINYRNIVIKHNDVFGHVDTVKLQRLNKGEIKNPYKPNVCNIGYIGVGDYNSWLDGRMTREYDAWKSMMYRCYDVSTQSRQPAYIGVTVCNEWHNFQEFAYWYCNHPDYNKGYHLDKDILYPGNRLYSPTTCCLVPMEINTLFIVKSSPGLEHLSGVRSENDYHYAKAGGVYLGSFNSEDDAINAYRSSRRDKITTLMNKWQGHISNDAYRALESLLNKY